MPIQTVDDIAASLSLGLNYSYMKILTAAKAAGSWQGAWLGTGFPGAGAAPPAYTAGSGYTCDRTTAGALGQSNGAVQNWLARCSAGSAQIGSIRIYDRLWNCSGMGFAAATYTVTTPGSLPARITDSGVGVEAWVDQNVAAGAASGTLTLNYLNTAAASKSGVIAAVVSAPVIGQQQPFPLQVGDVGISQVTSVVNNATWTSGSWGITLRKLVCEIPVYVAGVPNLLDWSQVLSKIPANACLEFVYQAVNTTATTIMGVITVIDK